MEPLDAPTLALLRASAKDRTADGSFALCLPPFIALSPHLTVEPLWELHAYGRVVARWHDPALFIYILTRERAEPGWLALALDARVDPETALRPLAETQAQFAALAASAEAEAAQRALDDDASWRARRVHLLSPSAINLEDLL